MIIEMIGCQPDAPSSRAGRDATVPVKELGEPIAPVPPQPMGFRGSSFSWRQTHMRKCFPAIMLLTGIFAVAVLHANGWTAAGSTGIIDEADLNKIVLNNDGSASIASTVNSVTAKVRFNITDVSGVEPSEEEGQIGNIPGIEIAYRDNGPGARVYVKVKRIHIGLAISGGQLGAVDELATMDSDTHPASSGWQTMSSTMRQVDSLCCRAGLRFPDYAYVVEVQLIKSASTGNPGLLGLQFFNDQA